jgi:hypothetical protein
MIPRSLMGVRESLNQLRFEPEFRISATLGPEQALALSHELEALLRGHFETIDEPAGGSPELDFGFLATLATGLWRADRAVRKEGTDQPREGMEKPHRFIQSLLVLLETQEIRIRDHRGEIIGGRLIEAIAFQPTPGLAREEIIETIRPSVMWGDRLIQVSQVIVSTPPGAAPRPEQELHLSGGPTDP